MHLEDAGDADVLWITCSESIRAQVSEAVWRPTFSGAKAVAFDEGELVLVVPNSLQKERIEGRYLGLVQDAIEDTSADVPGAPVLYYRVFVANGCHSDNREYDDLP